MSDDLKRYQELVDKRIAERIESCKGNIPGHLMKIFSGYLMGGGKRLRPKLLMLSCEAFGGKAEDVVSAAAAVEMFHNWTLIHDDIIDHDALRRGKPTGHVIGAEEGRTDFGLDDVCASSYGMSAAILAGDLLQSISIDEMCLQEKTFPDVTPAIVARMAGKATLKLIAGEQLDVEFSHVDFEKLTEAAVQIMMNGKTSALFSFCVAAGAAFGLRSVTDNRIDAMERFGSNFGLSFQIQDDILGIFGNTAKLGKTVGADIREGKRTLLAVRTLNALKGEQRARFLELYGRESITADDIQEVRKLMLESGAVDSVREMARKATQQALMTLKGVLPPSPAFYAMAEMTESMLKREV